MNPHFNTMLGRNSMGTSTRLSRGMLCHLLERRLTCAWWLTAITQGTNQCNVWYSWTYRNSQQLNYMFLAFNLLPWRMELRPYRALDTSFAWWVFPFLDKLMSMVTTCLSSTTLSNLSRHWKRRTCQFSTMLSARLLQLGRYWCPMCRQKQFFWLHDEGDLQSEAMPLGGLCTVWHSWWPSKYKKSRLSANTAQ